MKKCWECVPVLTGHGTNWLILPVPARAGALGHPDSSVLVGPQTVHRLAFNLGHDTCHLQVRESRDTTAGNSIGLLVFDQIVKSIYGV